MASTGTYTKSPQWWKHLRKYWKRRFHKAERRAVKHVTKKEAGEKV